MFQSQLQEPVAPGLKGPRRSADRRQTLAKGCALRLERQFGIKGVARATAVSLLVSMVTALPVAAIGSAAVSPTSSIGALAETPLPPSTVVLSTDRTTLSAGESAVLTAAVDQPLQATSSILEIWDVTTATRLQACTTSLTCAATIALPPGGPQTARLAVLELEREHV